MRYIYYVQKVYSEYIILKIQFVGMMTQGRDWCQPDCIPNVHLMQIHKYKYANTQIQIRKYTNTDSVKLAQRPNMQIQKLFPHPIYYGWCQPDCIPNVHLMQAPTKVATIAFSIFSRSWQYSTYSR